MEYLLRLQNIATKNSISSNKYTGIRKYKNEKFEILTKLKNLNLPESRSKDLFRFRKI